MKVCSRCKKEKDYSKFHKQNRNPDGYKYECKDCAKERSDEYINRPERKEYVKGYSANKYIEQMNKIKCDDKLKKKYREMCKEKNKKYYKVGNAVVNNAISKYRQTFPEKVRAKRRITYLKSIGELQAIDGYDYHHWSYLEEHRSDVILLKRDQHKFIHTQMFYDKNYYQYRTIDGLLLDSRDKHIEYINKYLN